MNDRTKLPKWAQEEIRDLEMQRDAAVTGLNEFTNSQTKSDIWFEDNPCTGEIVGPVTKRRYIQSDSVTFKLGKEEIDVRIGFDAPVLIISSGWNALTVQPVASNQIRILETKR